MIENTGGELGKRILWFDRYKDLDYRQVITYLKKHPDGILNLRLNKYGDIIGKGMDISKLEQLHYICIGRVVDDSNKLIGYDMMSYMGAITFMTINEAKECVLHDFIYNMSFVKKIKDKHNHDEVASTAIRVQNKNNIAYTRNYKNTSKVYENYSHKTFRYFI